MCASDVCEDGWMEMFQCIGGQGNDVYFVHLKSRQKLVTSFFTRTIAF